ncbi:MAG: hypothetical protein HY695_08840 [Deltaproteobacteria bacterium]|nr:hypothetical protein [Deltaproteobacteria bacterium]
MAFYRDCYPRNFVKLCMLFIIAAMISGTLIMGGCKAMAVFLIVKAVTGPQDDSAQRSAGTPVQCQDAETRKEFPILCGTD